jgi:hypothetical protein
MFLSIALPYCLKKEEDENEDEEWKTTVQMELSLLDSFLLSYT